MKTGGFSAISRSLKLFQGIDCKAKDRIVILREKDSRSEIGNLFPRCAPAAVSLTSGPGATLAPTWLGCKVRWPPECMTSGPPSGFIPAKGKRGGGGSNLRPRARTRVARATGLRCPLCWKRVRPLLRCVRR